MTDSLTCTICADNDVDEDVTTLDCGHTFHVGCIVQWFRYHNDTCPNCRSTHTWNECTLVSERRRVWQMVRKKSMLDVTLRRRVEQYERRKKRLKDLRAALRVFAKEHREVFAKFRRMRRDVLRCDHEVEELHYHLSHSVTDRVPLVEPRAEGESSDSE